MDEPLLKVEMDEGDDEVVVMAKRSVKWKLEWLCSWEENTTRGCESWRKEVLQLLGGRKGGNWDGNKNQLLERTESGG